MFSEDYKRDDLDVGLDWNALINIASSSYAQIREKSIQEQKELLAAAHRAYEQQVEGTSKRGPSLSSIKLVKQRSIEKKNKIK